MRVQRVRLEDNLREAIVVVLALSGRCRLHVQRLFIVGAFRPQRIGLEEFHEFEVKHQILPSITFDGPGSLLHDKLLGYLFIH